jgi:hypothetical protein
MAIVSRALVRDSDGLIDNMIAYDTEGSWTAPTGYSLVDIVASAGDSWDGSTVTPKTVIVDPFQTRYSAAANDAERIVILAEMLGLTA